MLPWEEAGLAQGFSGSRYGTHGFLLLDASEPAGEPGWGWRQQRGAGGGGRLAVAGDTHSRHRGSAAAPASRASASFSCPGKYDQVLMALWGSARLAGRNRVEHWPGTPTSPGTAKPTPPQLKPQVEAPPGAWQGTRRLQGCTYVVVPRRPRRVELRVQLPLLPRQLVVLRLLLPRQRVPLWERERPHWKLRSHDPEDMLLTPKPRWRPQNHDSKDTLLTPKPHWKPQSHAGNLKPKTPKPRQKPQSHDPKDMLLTLKPRWKPQTQNLKATSETPKPHWKPQSYAGTPKAMTPRTHC